MPPSVSRRRLLGLGVVALAGCLSNPGEHTGSTEGSGDESTPEPDTTASPMPRSGCGREVASQFNVRESSPAVPSCPDKPATLDPCAARRFALGLEKHRRYAGAINSPSGAPEVAFGVTPQTSVREAESGFIVFVRLNFRVIRTGDGGDLTPTGTPPETPTGTETRSGTPVETTATTERDPIGLYNVHYLVTPDGQWRAVRFDQFDTAEALRRAGSPVGCGDA